MKKTPVNATDSAILRQKAEAKLKSRQTAESITLPDTDALKLVQELRLQQAELEMQNKELRAVLLLEGEAVKNSHKLEVLEVELESQNEELRSAAALTKDATDLYDFAPTGYFTLSGEGEILRLNISGANLLGKDRSKLVKAGLFFLFPTKPGLNSIPFSREYLKTKPKDRVK